MAVENEKTPDSDGFFTKENEILSENEKLILFYIRKGDAKTITIKFANKKPCSMEVVCEKKIKIEARLCEIFQKHKFQELNIKTSNGSIVYSTIKTQIKLRE